MYAVTRGCEVGHVQAVPFIVSLSSEALSQRKPVSAGTFRDSCPVQEHLCNVAVVCLRSLSIASSSISGASTLHFWCEWQHGASRVRVKQSHCRPWQALRVPGGWGSQSLRQSAHEGGKVVNLRHRPPLPKGNIPVLISVRGWVDPRAIVRLCQWKIQMAPSGIDPETFRFVAQCLKHCATACPYHEWSCRFLRTVTPCWLAESWRLELSRESLKSGIRTYIHT
jgi:hypothetical protein